MVCMGCWNFGFKYYVSSRKKRCIFLHILDVCEFYYVFGSFGSDTTADSSKIIIGYWRSKYVLSGMSRSCSRRQIIFLERHGNKTWYFLVFDVGWHFTYNFTYRLFRHVQKSAWKQRQYGFGLFREKNK